MSDVGLIAAVLFGYSLISRRLERAQVSAPMFFVAAGIILGPDVAGVTDLELTSETGLLLAEVALVIVLFSDASRIDLRALRRNRGLPERLLGIGMPLTIALGTAAGALLLTEIEFWEAAMIAAVLAPTDAALGQAVVSSKRVPQRIRQALNVESGLNDGLSIPFLFLFTGLAVTEAEVSAGGWVRFALEQIGYGALVGAGVGLAGAWLVDRASQREWINGTFQQLSMIALALGAWALAGELGGNGFIAAFVAGLTAGRVTEVCSEKILDFTEDEGQLLNLAVFFIFGVSAIGFLDGAGWEVFVYGLLSLTVVRMLPVGIALAGAGLRRSSVALHRLVRPARPGLDHPRAGRDRGGAGPAGDLDPVRGDDRDGAGEHLRPRDQRSSADPPLRPLDRRRRRAGRGDAAGPRAAGPRRHRRAVLIACRTG